MNKRISKNGISVIARSYNDMLNDPEFKYYSTKAVFDKVVSLLADMLEADNDNFDRDRFYNVVYKEV